uniref:ShKT domain-containing protein n=1 Tax=Pseudo-nitzschia australis TaxID=44445 RepID=A0A7S4ADZ1_9STRA
MRLSNFIFAISIIFQAASAAPLVEKESTPCKDKKKLRFKIKNRKKSCKWASRKTKKRCRKKSNGIEVRILCPAACNSCPDEPTPAPVARNSSGCCSLDYKNCIDWCGPTYDSCMNCASKAVTWLPDGAPLSSCSERWTGCTENNDTNDSSCCSGLRCQPRNDYMECMADDDSLI